MATELDPFFYFWPTDNVAPLATMSVETGTEDAAYVAANAVDFTQANIAKPAKINESSGAWEGDFGTAQRVDLVVLWSNADESVGSPGPSVRFQMNASASWTSPTIDELFTIPPRRADGYAIKPFIDLRDVSGYTSSGLRYFRVVFDSQTDPVAMKVLLFSTVRQLSRDVQWGRQDADQHIDVVMKTDAGVRWGYDLASAPRLITSSASLPTADIEASREWFRASAGLVRPTVIIPDPLVNDAWVVYWSSNGFSIESPNLVVANQRQTLAAPDNYDTSFSFEEVAIGDPEWF